MNEEEARFVRVTIGFLASHMRELATHVGALTAVVQSLLIPGGLTIADGADFSSLLETVERGVDELETSLLRIMDAFPPEVRGSGNGGGKGFSGFC